MNETERCLNMINAIDDSVLLSEGYVLSKQVALSEKVETMFSIMGDAAEMYMTEASVGTGVTSGYKPNILQRIWDFIRKVVHAVINKFSDVLTKMKIRNYESVEIPMSFEDFKHDVNLLIAISGKFKDSLQGKTDYEESNKTDFSGDYSKQIVLVKKLIEETKQFRILKVTDKQKSSIDPDKFMEMRDRIRYGRQYWNDTYKHITNMNKTINSSSETSESYKQYSQEMQKLFAEFAKVSTKLFEGLKFGNINAPEKKADKKDENKK